MLLTISTTHRPATDLGHLLMKHPDKVQSFDTSAGPAYVCYPQADDERCTAALVLDVDPVALARRRDGRDFTLGRYVNDRPYAASSLLSVALGKVFGTALSGRSKSRPDLAATPIPLTLDVPVLRGTPELCELLFAPLGWTVTADAIPLDPDRPEWGDAPYVRLRLTGVHTVAAALGHLYVLLPVLDDAKHYWVTTDEVEKLLRAGAGWLAAHPSRNLITRRYLKRKGDLVRAARVALLSEEVAGLLDDPADATDAAPDTTEATEATEAAEALGRPGITDTGDTPGTRPAGGEAGPDAAPALTQARDTAMPTDALPAESTGEAQNRTVPTASPAEVPHTAAEQAQPAPAPVGGSKAVLRHENPTLEQAQNAPTPADAIDPAEVAGAAAPVGDSAEVRDTIAPTASPTASAIGEAGRDDPLTAGSAAADTTPTNPLASGREATHAASDADRVPADSVPGEAPGSASLPPDPTLPTTSAIAPDPAPTPSPADAETGHTPDLAAPHRLAPAAPAVASTPPVAAAPSTSPDRVSTTDPIGDATEPRPLSLLQHRHRAVLAALKASGARTVADLGCGSGALLAELFADHSFTRVLGADVSSRALEMAERRLRLDRRGDLELARIELIQTALTYTDDRLKGFDAAVLMEVIEHLDEPRLPALAQAVLGHAAPGTVVMTTPNSEYNPHYEGLTGMRHHDHRFEWDRATFAAWCGEQAGRYGYRVELHPVGDLDPEAGAPTQMAVFTKEAAR